MVVLGELLIVGGTAIVIASGIFFGLGRLTSKSYCVDRKRIRIILLRSQHLEVTQQISVIKSWQGLVGTLPVSISQKQPANGSSPNPKRVGRFNIATSTSGTMNLEMCLSALTNRLLAG